MFPLDKGLQWVNVKQKPFRQIWAHLGIIKHIQAYLEPSVTLIYFITVVYPEP